MNNKEGKTLRLLMPQWQGGDNPPYYLGAKLLEWLAPDSNDIQEEVPVSLSHEGLKMNKGIFARDVLLKQFHDAFDILQKHDPDRVIVFGGDCAVELAPIAYLNEKYDGDVAVLWVDAHPDVDNIENQPEYHAHVLASLMGLGDKDFTDVVPKKIDSNNVLYVGLNSWQQTEKEVIDNLNLSIVTPEDIANNSTSVLEWLNNINASKVFIHFDLDVIDLREFRSLLIANPNVYEKMSQETPQGSSIETIIRVLQDVASSHDVIGLGITEHFPWDAYALQNMLQRIPLIGDIHKKDKPAYNWKF